MTATLGASDCTAAMTPAWSGPGSSTSSTSRAGSRARMASSTPMPAPTGLTLTPSARRLRSTEADAAVDGSASTTWSFGGTNTRDDMNAAGYGDAPPGGAAGSIAAIVAYIRGDNNRLTAAHPPVRYPPTEVDRSPLPERSTTPNGAARERLVRFVCTPARRGDL